MNSTLILSSLRTRATARTHTMVLSKPEVVTNKMATSVKSAHNHNAVLKEPMGGGPHGLGNKILLNVLVPSFLNSVLVSEI